MCVISMFNWKGRIELGAVLDSHTLICMIYYHLFNLCVISMFNWKGRIKLGAVIG